MFLVVNRAIELSVYVAFVDVPRVIIITVPEPLSAGLITTSERSRRLVRAVRSSLDKLFCILEGCEENDVVFEGVDVGVEGRPRQIVLGNF